VRVAPKELVEITSGRPVALRSSRYKPPLSPRLFFLFAFLVAAVGSVAGQGVWGSKAVPGDNFCTVCHSDMQVQLQQSVHAREGIKCGDCHGGDPRAQTVAGAHVGSFRGRFDRKQSIELCSSCHSDQAKMKPYGIPTDQYVLYLTSVHGKRLIQGDGRVAVCSDCHGTHNVLAASDPKSPVYRENIPQTCGRCHEDGQLMKVYNLPANVVSEYRAGVHGKALLERHNRQAPDCTRCHGTHGAAPPGVGDVARVCGQCHTRTLESFRQSPHQTVMATSGTGECTSCHSNHRVEPASHQMWSSSCSSCHKSESPAADRGNKIQALFTQAEAEVEKAKLSIEEARRIPLQVDDYEASLSDARTYLVEARPLSHDLSVDDVEDLTRRSRSIALAVQSEIHQKVNVFGGRIIVLIFVWFYILVSVAVVLRYRRVIERRRSKNSEQH
jgi:predicted CXXCH cytochrome family protein